MRVVILAFVCRPAYGSEDGIGWQFLRAAAREHEVTLLTHSINREEVKRALAAEGLEAKIIAFPGLRLLGKLEWRLGIGHIAYLLWQYRALRRIRRLGADVDVVHHVTFGNDWLPSAAHFLDGTPAVWGPVGGNAPVAWRLVRFLSVRGVLRELVRETVTRIVRRVTTALVRRSNCLVVAVNPDTADIYDKLGLPVLTEFPAAIEPVAARRSSTRRAAETRRRTAVFVGRLIVWKGPYLALSALASAGDAWTLDMYGEGPEGPGLRRRAERLGVSDRVRLLGRRPREEVLAALTEADVLLFPSMHDPSPFAVAEAVSVGCPVVCLDVGGPPLLIAGTTGEAVRPGWRAADRLADAMNRVRPHPPSDRWSRDRLGSLVTEWYEVARHESGTARYSHRPYRRKPVFQPD